MSCVKLSVLVVTMYAIGVIKGDPPARVAFDKSSAHAQISQSETRTLKAYEDQADALPTGPPTCAWHWEVQVDNRKSICVGARRFMYHSDGDHETSFH